MPANLERGPRIQFSLRTFLVVCCALGVGLGVLGRLYFRNPEVFLVVLALLSYAVPFLTAIATILWMGLRSKPAGSAPICAKCRQDVRPTAPDRTTSCPQCGADLTGRKAVLFARGRGRRWGLIAWACVLLAMPIVGTGVLGVVRQRMGPSPGALGLLSTQQLLQQRLPKQIDEPWVWNELENRLRAGTLSQQDVDDAIKALVLHMTTTRPQGWNSPLHWQSKFVNAAARAGLISEAELFALCDAYYGPKAAIRPLARLREGQQGVNIEIECGSAWGGDSGPGLEFLWQIERVLLDGKPVKFRQDFKHPQRWSGYHDASLKAGDHEITVEVASAYVDPNKLIGLIASDLPLDLWPPARKRWKQSVSAPLKVYRADEAVVALTVDPSRAPGRGGGIKIGRLVAQRDRGGSRKIILTVGFDDGLSVPLSYDVAAVIAGETVKLGYFWRVQHANGRTEGGSQLEARVATLDPSIRSGDVVLTPNPRHIEHLPEVSEIWGQQTMLRGIPLERLDLEVKPPDPHPSPQTSR